jgi:hypothetical protein
MTNFRENFVPGKEKFCRLADTNQEILTKYGAKFVEKAAFESMQPVLN